MKAKLLVDYSEVKKGSEFKVIEIIGTRCSVLIEKKIVDFGISEVELICKTNSDLFEIGKDINFKTGFKMRNSDIEKSIKDLKYPLSKILCKKAIYHYLNA